MMLILFLWMEYTQGVNYCKEKADDAASGAGRFSAEMLYGMFIECGSI